MSVGRGDGGETVTASLCLVFKFKRRGVIFVPPLIKSVKNLFLSNQGIMKSITCSCAVVIFETSEFIFLK